MKKIVTLVLAIALLMTSIVAIAESKAIPNINTFAKMTTKFIEGSDKEAKRYEIKLSKPVDKLWIIWAEKGAEPDELAVDENLCATALAVEHKYMPGIKQSIGTSKKTITVEDRKVVPSEEAGKYVWKNTVTDKGKSEWPKDPVYFVDEVKKLSNNSNIVVYGWDAATGKPNDITLYYDIVNYKGEADRDWVDFESMEELLAWAKMHWSNYDVEIDKAPEAIKTGDKKVVDKFGNKADEIVGFKNGSLKFTKTETSVNKKLATNKATLADRAFATLEGVTEDFAGWLVYRNRFGNFVAIEPYEGQL